MKLIINQPLHPVERIPVNRPLPQSAAMRPVSETAAPITTPRLLPVLSQARPTTNDMSVIRPNGHANMNGVSSSGPLTKPVPKPRPKIPQPVGGPVEAGPSRRPPSPNHASEPPKKKIKESTMVTHCVVCDQPAHSLSQCPIVKGGPERFVNVSLSHCSSFAQRLFRRIEKEIRRLRKDPAKTEAVDKLQKILLKQRSHPTS